VKAPPVAEFATKSAASVTGLGARPALVRQAAVASFV
jgi:hypothetical protein